MSISVTWSGLCPILVPQFPHLYNGVITHLFLGLLRVLSWFESAEALGQLGSGTQ